MTKGLVKVSMLATGQIYTMDPEAADVLIAAGEAELAKPDKRKATSKKAEHRETR